MQKSGLTELQRIAFLIEAEASQLKEFLALLEREEALLISGDTDRLPALIQEKTGRYRQLQHLHDDRAILLTRAGFANDSATLRKLCVRLPKTLARWDEVLALATQARERNTVNGKLIAERMRHNQGALSALLAAANHPQLYDAAGHSRPTGSGRMLGSA
ncbi:MAG: flagellar protein FlgN [Azoarcus sp.]|jgi:flagella synthesis protein FlgN|nr:flagellar protein FlgN [Azoarcus sp.]